MAETGVTPSMAQYFEIKDAHPECLLFFQMGDFYELFFDDAVAAAAALDIALTKRGKHKGADIAMCGVPLHAATNYLLTLIRKGFRVAICDQVEDPAEARKRGSKAVVRREVVRVVTPGTLTEDQLLDARRHNFLAAWSEIRDDGALAWADVSTGDLAVAPVARMGLGPLLARVAPSEVLLSPAAADEAGLADLIEETGTVATALGASAFDSASAVHRLCDLFGVATLEGFGAFERPELSALGALASYLETTQKGRLPILRPPRREEPGRVMRIDAATRRNLELTRAMAGGRAGSLIDAIDRTVTGAGARLLETRLAAPLTDVSAIRDRHDGAALMVADAAMRDAVRVHLRAVPELDRAMSRLALDRAGPRDLAAVRTGLAKAPALEAILSATPDLPRELAEAAAAMTGHETLAAMLDRALIDEPPLLTRDGGFVAAGYHCELDDARRLRDDGRKVIAAMQADYVNRTGVQTLKVKHNNVLGYFIEVTALNADRLTGDAEGLFIHRQTMANAMRFTTVALSEIENKIANATARALDLEKAVFADLRDAVLARQAEIAATARALAAIDVAAAAAALAVENRWTRPEIEASRSLRISGGRHPVVEQALSRTGTGFVANDCDLSADPAGSAPIWLLTGPNMAGKSTFLRQNALIAILAQAGLYVPAEAARIGVVDQLFSRVGAADDLARGRSTFMVEMVETAAILNQAGPGALVILDEIGRGTATWDGLSIAWATLEHLHEVNRCRGLFATHYHELTRLADKLPHLSPATVAVREWEGEIIFLHEVRAGAADRSYGVQVARLAGLPETVVARARDVLEKLEAGAREGSGVPADLADALPLFSAAAQRPAPTVRESSAVEAALRSADPDQLTPRAALELIYGLRAMLSD
ncbi:MAG: DNA mismatch repair protein MutS [Pseudomonadota bacterium]